MDKEIIEAWEWYNSHPPWIEFRELVKKINDMATEYYRKKGILLSYSLIPEDYDFHAHLICNIDQECFPDVGPHVDVKESSPTVPTWVFRPGKDVDGKISVWWIGKKGSEKSFNVKLKGVKQMHDVLKHQIETGRPKPVTMMETPAKHRITVKRNCELALNQLAATALGSPDLEEIVAHLKNYIHIGTMCRYNPGEDVINWILV